MKPWQRCFLVARAGKRWPSSRRRRFLRKVDEVRLRLAREARKILERARAKKP